MSCNPFLTQPDVLAVDALNILKKNNISGMPVCIGKKL